MQIECKLYFENVILNFKTILNLDFYIKIILIKIFNDKRIIGFWMERFNSNTKTFVRFSNLIVYYL